MWQSAASAECRVVLCERSPATSFRTSAYVTGIGEVLTRPRGRLVAGGCEMRAPLTARPSGMELGCPRLGRGAHSCPSTEVIWRMSGHSPGVWATVVVAAARRWASATRRPLLLPLVVAGL